MATPGVSMIMRVTQTGISKRRRMWKRSGEFALLKGPVFIFLMVSLLMINSFALAVPSTLRITIGTFAPYYSPTLVHINTGTPVSWNNPTAALHSITHDECKNGPRCAFDSGPLGPKGTYTVHQLPPGSYSYHCTFHPIMRGVLVVRDSENPRET